MKIRSIILLILSLSVISGCSWLGWGEMSLLKTKPLVTPKSIFTRKFRAASTRATGRWRLATWSCWSHSFPLASMPSRPSLNLMYAQFKSGDHDSSIAAADRFIRLHPQHPNVDYAFYVKGLSEISQSSSAFDNFLPTDSTQRDIGTARNAFGTFSELLNRFPKSPYAADARKR